ncbi:hypothetical protein PIB30_062620 [Stylosanthes scabra]|uniref:Membrane insertase YidC/Oxa/ALB C-terminal domain-containing protein n=1 Tax=Stylosanthes scabra TaxID=79078 RepID=A0ABU6RM14_9FABA|nr:hypothetical protein [Stylosanthes scabra]
MAYRRCLLKRGSLVDWKCHPSFSYVIHNDDGKRERPEEKSSSAGINSFVQTRSFGSSFNGSMGFGASSRVLSNTFLSPCSGYNFCRYMSTVNNGSDKIEMMTDIADVLNDKVIETIASQAPVIDEVAIAAADSYLPVKLLQYGIDAVHTYAGLNWWAAIALTTLVIRTATVPLLVYQLKATSKLTMLRPHMERIRAEMEYNALDPVAAAERQKKMDQLFKEYGVSPYTPLMGLFIQGPIFISFFLAISNMAEKVPSFKHGGTYWFTDLTTPDALYILPVLTALSFLITVEAIFCYWVTSNLFSLVYGLALKVPGVKKTLGIPEIVAETPTTPTTAPEPQSPFNVFPALKKFTSEATEPSTSPAEPSKHSNKKISSSAVLSQRLKSLEKQVKGRKKNLKR